MDKAPITKPMKYDPVSPLNIFPEKKLNINNVKTTSKKEIKNILNS